MGSLFNPRRRSLVKLLGFLLLGMLAGSDVAAHFLLNVNIRIIHAEHLAEGMRIYLRLPMALVVAGRLGPVQANGKPLPAPYTVNGFENGNLMHWVDVEALRRDPHGLGEMVADGHSLLVNGEPIAPELEAIHVYPAIAQPLFATLADAKATADLPIFPPNTAASYVGDTVVDVTLFYRTGRPIYSFSFGSNLDPGLPGEKDTANLLLDYQPHGTQIYRATGLLMQPIEVARSRLGAAITFVKDGIAHIADGKDHILFILCLTLGATSLHSVVWRITGFTVGHTITLIAGFLGYAPRGAWFIPMVELLIALSIVYVGVAAVLRRPEAASFVIAALIGLLHGFGFSFVLHQILQIDSPDLWVSLLSFNVGVELGQLIVVILTVGVLFIVDRFFSRYRQITRATVALACIAVAALWVGQRSFVLLQQI